MHSIASPGTRASDRPGDGLLVFGAADGLVASALGTAWTAVTDQVMGGVSAARVEARRVEGLPCVCLAGDVRLDNDGGFVQMALDLAPAGPLDAAAYAGVELLVRGNGESYNLHLKTPALRYPWQSFRHAFVAAPRWTTKRLPFTAFVPHRTAAALDPSALTRLGVVAIGRAFRAEVCVARVVLYRAGAPSGDR
jgi:hypothetical protein